ncbi:hypothetical protein QN412_21190 [Pseudomonas sp. RTB3]|uniref:hypothetical protein n=1 Tax=Pseudomonas sp. RTB2 TaxID=3048632 RepID=UPI002B238A83|nr:MULTISPECIES: hypothetical protein [unclassified Pseudomonas]MEB0007259.1 hypothetical protein [Pseudomonas sp. RTB2]MEB0019442.1 hypothetical protein [Pseudomonas sp. RTB3]MEB0270401.1 hypothetical protein [Pseudomonas sp. 5B4]
MASRTQHSTEEIQDIIDTLRRSTGEAVAAMRRSHRMAEVSVEQALLAAGALDGINQRVSEISEMSEMSVQIAAAVEEQSAVGGDIQRNLDGIRMATDSNVVTSSQSRTALRACRRTSQTSAIVGGAVLGPPTQKLSSTRFFYFFNLTLHPEKTRLLHFGWHEVEDRRSHGLEKAGDVLFSRVHACL